MGHIMMIMIIVIKGHINMSESESERDLFAMKVGTVKEFALQEGGYNKYIGALYLNMWTIYAKGT